VTVPRIGEASEGEGPARAGDGRAISGNWKGESSAAARLAGWLAGCSGFSWKTGGGRKTALQIQSIYTMPPDTTAVKLQLCVCVRACVRVRL
jgi:hypothetical protein